MPDIGKPSDLGDPGAPWLAIGAGLVIGVVLLYVLGVL